jgi:predicted ATPase
LQVAADALDGTGDGVWLVELAPVAQPELVTRTVAAALRVSEAPGRPVLGTLIDAVGDREPTRYLETLVVTPNTVRTHLDRIKAALVSKYGTAEGDAISAQYGQVLSDSVNNCGE